MPGPDDRTRFKDRYRRSNLYEDHDRSGHSDWSRGMQHDAQRAMAGFGLQRVHVRYLNDSQERQQNKTQGHRKGSLSQASVSAASC